MTTAQTGSIKADITSDAHLTPGEDRTVRWVCKDENGTNISDFTGWTFAFYLLPSQRTALTSSDVLLTKTASSLTAPNIDITFAVADTSDITPRAYFYELWRTDTGNKIRLAYGQFTLID